jgi:hypothetical protein
MTRIQIRRNGAVDCQACLEIPLAAVSVWGQIRDFRRFARQDFFHDVIDVAGGQLRQGAALSLVHRYAFISIRRRGRICWWREGVGYSFSDLSLRGARRGFPHILSYRIEQATEPKACRLIIRVRGRWTAEFVPRSLARIWLWWVFRHVVHSVENQLLSFGLWRRDRTVPAITAK